MKKHLLLFIIVTITYNESKAQYHPMLGDTTEWCVPWDGFPVRSGVYMEKCMAYETTLLDSNSYKKIWSDNTWPTPTDIGLIREDTSARKVFVFMYDMSSEVLAYDFNMNLGDSIYYAFPNPGNTFAAPGYYYVDSVGTINIRGGARKYMRLFNPLNTWTTWGGNNFKLEIVESVGELHDPLFFLRDLQPASGNVAMNCGTLSEYFLLKNTIDNVKNYVNICAAQNILAFVGPDTCQVVYSGSVDDLSKQIQTTIYPNPTNGSSLTIDVNNYVLKDHCVVVISDALGRKVYSTKVNPVDNSIVLKNLLIDNGTYFVNVTDDKVVFAKAKLVIKN